ncbi:ultraviolet-B receptor UVR8 isoform X2 [Nymphaea colorata]|uniref:ultraviolet-B receptor UVR8 isoform X2 n=1 Tax=Nymphaea colorata TaxID=210225 RepID=UPI00129E3640|nr:ultraviolet-B receptor UVR8 isoform X2 [Nymphaea colorata]
MSGGEGGEGEKEKKKRRSMVYMWGYLPGATPQRSPILSPEPVAEAAGGEQWRDVCGGGCGFAMAISESGKLNTWGSTDELGQGYVTSGKHEENPEPFPLPTEATIINAAAGWAHCVAVTENGGVYTWGWKECVPTGRVVTDQSTTENLEKDVTEKHNGSFIEEVSPKSQVSHSILRRQSSGSVSKHDNKVGEEGTKRRKLSTAKQTSESPTTEEAMSALPCLVSLSPGVRIAMVAAGGRHTLALSDVGQVWGWGYGGEGQLGLGSRIRMISSPHPIACVETSSYVRDRIPGLPRRGVASDSQVYKVPGTCIKAIACGGRHSAVVTDAGALLTFGWGLYGQCGQGSTDDELSPSLVSSLWGVQIGGVAAGLWHTICTSVEGQVYAFGGNQFGQLGTGNDQAETLPRLLSAPSLENKHAKLVSCGARHSAILTEEGDVFSWGWNKYGQLGLGDVIDRSIPSQVPLIDCHPTKVACGWWHTLLLAESPP